MVMKTGSGAPDRKPIKLIWPEFEIVIVDIDVFGIRDRRPRIAMNKCWIICFQTLPYLWSR
jgi:hypothetical protein